jgi:AcrR family transcriptional regulator
MHRTLLDAAVQLFAERGVSGTTVDDIAEAADVARQTVFNHFPYKEALAVELAAQGIEAIAHHAHAMLEAGTPALQVLRCVGLSVLDMAISQGEPAVVAAHEAFHPDPQRAAWASERVPLTNLFQAILQQAVEEGAVRPDVPLNVAASRLSAILISMIAQSRQMPSDGLRNELDTVFDILFNGITERSD